MNKWLSTCFLLSLFSCHQPTPLPNDPTYACDYSITFHGQALKTAIFYSTTIDSYYTKSIYVDSPKGTLATNEGINLFCNLPDEYQRAGKVISFDGGFAPINDSTGRASALQKIFPGRRLTYVVVTKIY
ncbi:hypothetical protein [Spirosoma pollinicola]|uniref:Uncharacterized protein n=1 Tax=Spirosoma pollinicola TaxID=2057025 RepID=A0A2K8ZB51_9BACT|nr:hypothetical protein [Spirosoma pollinicola]AUD07049.1 hypothetical protein CWM47_37665 [Spirosoma pollinicola]